MLKQINMLREKGQNDLYAITSTDQLPEWYHQYLGRKGDLTSLLKQLGTLSSEERPVMGKVINKVKQQLQESFELHQKTLKETKLNQELEIILVTFHFRCFVNLKTHFLKNIVNST